jgi:hypothetical protein
VLEDVLGDIGGWEDTALAEAVEEVKRDLVALADVIRLRDGDAPPAPGADVVLAAALQFSHRLDDEAQGVTERRVYELATELRQLLGLDGAEVQAAQLAKLAAQQPAPSAEAGREVPPIDQLERMRHIANEWADMATNGMQWLRNIRDGISTVEDAIANMDDNYKHCRKVNDATGLYGQDAPTSAGGAQ